jgi:hypothetical protein
LNIFDEFRQYFKFKAMLKEYAARLLQRHLGTDSLRRLSQKALEAQRSSEMLKDPCHSDIPRMSMSTSQFFHIFSVRTTLHGTIL